MGWRSDEVWLDSEVLWFFDRPRVRGVALVQPMPAFAPAGMAPPVALDRPRRTTAEERRAERRRRFATRTAPAVALVIGSATMLPIAALRHEGTGGSRALAEDPPSQTFRLDLSGLERLETPVARPAAREAAPAARRSTSRSTATARTAAEEPAAPVIEWNQATSHGLPFAGSLENGTQLPVEGPDWVTWNPVVDSVPNLPNRLYGNERTIHTLLSVIAAYRAAHPEAPRVVVGDISLRHGGTMNEHASHQNGLDVDVYYPRLDRWLRAPTDTSQIDRALAQDLLDRFVAAGAHIVFVGYSTGLRGPSGVVVPYPNHENHMHVRFPSP